MKTFTHFFRSLNDRKTKKSVLFSTISTNRIKFYIVGLFVAFTIQLNAATYYLKDGTNANLTSSWTTNSDETGSNPSNFTNKNDVFIIPAGKSGTVSSNWTIGTTSGTIISWGSWELRILGTLTVNNGCTVVIQRGTFASSTVNVNGSTGKLILETSAIITANTITSTSLSIININSGATLVTANPNGIKGSIVDIGLLFSRNFNTSANYEFNGVDQITNDLPTTVNNLTFTNTGSKTLGGNVYVSGTLLIQDEVSLDITSNRVLRANNVTNNAGKYGIVIHSSASEPAGTFIFANGSPEATVLFYSKAFKGTDTKYQFFGIPFTSMKPQYNLDGAWIYKYNESNVDMWEPVTNNTTMYPVQGYAITQDVAKTYEISGTLYNSSLSYPLSYTSSNSNTSDYTVGENIIANPYTCAIPVFLLNFTNAEETAYLYNTGSYNDWTTQSGSGNNPGQYLSVPKAIGSIFSQFRIPSMQGFLVKATAPGASISFNYSNTSNVLYNFGNADPLRVKSEEVDEAVYTAIDIKGENFGDNVWLFTHPTYTKSFDNGYDGRKIKGSALTPQLYAIEADGNYQVNAVDDIHNTLLGFVPGIDTEYTLKFTHSNTLEAYPNGIYLVDLLKNTTIDITESGSTYTFSTAASNVKAQKAPSLTAENARFKILTTPSITTNLDISNANSLKIFCSDKKVIVNNKESLEGELRLFDTSGRLVYSNTFGSGISTFDVELAYGVYIVQADNQIEKFKSTLIIK